MNADSVRKIVALNRQRTALKAMQKRGDITAAEFEIADTELAQKIAQIRSQADLPLSPPSKGGKSGA